MSLLHADLKTLCKSKGLHVSGPKAVLVDRLIADDKLLTERSARQIREVRAKAVVHGVEAQLRPWNLLEPAEVDKWLAAAERTCHERRTKAD